jgi:membrane protein DedA with SNARE-associated domain
MLDWITNFMNSMGYAAIVLLMFLENVFPPIPSELIMPLAGFIVTRGELTFAGVVLAGTLGSVLGALPLYYAGKLFGLERLKDWADRYGRWLTVSAADLDRGKYWFDRHGGATVLLCRLIPGIRSLISIPAGIGGMHMGVFLLYTTLGTCLWSGLLAYAGYQLGANYDMVEKYVGPVSKLILAALIITYLYRVVTYKPRSSG